MTPLSRPAGPREKAWALVRLMLGMSQVMGATAGVCLLLWTGLSTPTLCVVAVTTLLTLISRLLFRGRDK